MGNLITKLGATLFAGKNGAKTVPAPLIYGDIIDYTLSSDFVATAGQLDKGIFFKGDAEGTYTVLTWAQYQKYGGDISNSAAERLAAIVAAVSDSAEIELFLLKGQWSDTPVVRIDSTNAASTALNFGLY